MIKSIKTIMRQDREPYRVPRRVQDVIPIQCVWPDGIFKVGIKFSKTYRFTDINYKVASREDKETMFLAYSELLNGLDSAATTKLTICNRRQSQADFEQSVLMAMRGDGLDKYRQEYNQMLIDKATGANGIIQEKLVTVTVYKRDIEDARAYFTRIGADLTARFAALGSKCVELDAADRLRILHDFYRTGDEGSFHFDMADMARKGHDFKDYICPDGIEKHSDYLKLGDRYCRVLFLKDYANYIQDEIVADLTDLNRNMMLSIDILSVPTDEAVREVENRLLGVETNITNWQRRQNQNNNFSAIVPYDMELQRKESKEFLADLTTRDQRMMQAVLTLVITADSKQQLDSDTEKVRSLSGRCQLAVLKYQQLDGLNTVLPIGTRKIDAFRTLTTESLAVFMPFKVQEIMDKGGIYFGENAISHNLIMCNKANLLNQSSFRLGVPGSGKSFSVKEEIAFLILNTDDDSYGYNTILTTRRVFCYGILFMLPTLFLFDFKLELTRLASPVYLFNILFLGLGASALCFVTWNFAVKALGAVKTSVYIYMVPVITVVTSVAILHEKITALAAVGTVLTLAGLLLSESKLFLRKEAKQNGLAK